MLAYFYIFGIPRTCGVSEIDVSKPILSKEERVWDADTTVEPSGSAVGLIQRNTDEGRCPLHNTSEMLVHACLFVVHVVT